MKVSPTANLWCSSRSSSASLPAVGDVALPCERGGTWRCAHETFAQKPGPFSAAQLGVDPRLSVIVSRSREK